MSLSRIKIMGEACLLQPSLPVEDFGKTLDELVEQLTETMRAEGGVGIAAPQIGINQRVIIFGFTASDRYPKEKPVPHTVLINPAYEVVDATMVSGWEGCLSVPGLRGLVPRALAIRYWGINQQGERIEREASGFHARIIQHEVDHLDGILFPSRLVNWQDFGFEAPLWPRIYPINS